MIRFFNIETTEFNPVEVEFSLWFRLISSIKAFMGRRAAFTEFCRKSGIDLPVHPGEKYALPEEYTLEHSRLGQMGEVRDRIILSRYSHFEKCMSHLDIVIKNTEKDIERQEEYLKSCEAKLRLDEAELKKNKDPLMGITLENRIGTMRATIHNQSENLKSFKQKLSACQTTRRQNKTNWGRQLEIIEATTKNNYNSFCIGLGRRIEKVFSYDEFRYVPPKHSKSVNEILENEK